MASFAMAKAITLAIVVTFMLFKTTIAAVGCFDCTNSPHPADCDVVTECSQYEKCVVKQYVTTGGLILYSSGCQSKTTCTSVGKRNNDDVIHDVIRQSRQQNSDVITCAECCDGNYCNMAGCGITQVTQPARGPMCFACKTSESPETCRQVIECEQGMVCMVAQKIGTTEYESGCMTSKVCHMVTTLHHSTGLCSQCCSDDFCNNVCSSNSTTHGK